MPHLTASALATDPEGLAFLRDVLKSAPSAAEPEKLPTSVRAVLHPEKPARRASRGAKRFGLVGTAAAVGVLIAVAPAKPISNPPAAPQPAATLAAAESPATLRPVRRATKGAAVVSPDPSSSCQRARRTLWVADQGWVVRRVSNCS